MAARPSTPQLVHRTARICLRTTGARANRCHRLPWAAGDVWAWLLDSNRHRRRQGDPVVAGDQALCRQLTSRGGFGELSVVGARSVLQRYSDAWFEAARRHHRGERAGFPRRKRFLVPIRCYHGTFLLAGDRRVRAQRRAEARHRRRVHQAHHQAAGQVIAFAMAHRVGTLVVGDPTGITDRDAGRVQNWRLGQWRRTHLLGALRDKAEQAGIRVSMVQERGTSSTCPACRQRVPKPRGRRFACPHCRFQGHRGLVGVTSIAAKLGGGHPARRFPRWSSTVGSGWCLGPPPPASWRAGVSLVGRTRLSWVRRGSSSIPQPGQTLLEGALAQRASVCRAAGKLGAADGAGRTVGLGWSTHLSPRGIQADDGAHLDVER
jgi:IS605 OrfB family transposase